jgi:2-phosphosulfolactate phosphatase
VKARTPKWADQSGFGVRLAWGPSGIDALKDVAVIVLVDLLRFTTALEVAAASGASVRPAPWPFDPGLQADDTEVADGTGPRRLSLSPGSLQNVGSGDRIVLPSANGSHCSSLAAMTGALVVGACLRNATSVAGYVGIAARNEAIGIVPCGESWPDGTFRPAVEDLIGAGAVVAALGADRGRSPEALAAEGAFGACIGDLMATLAESASGRELRSKGLSGDVAWAAARDVSSTVPVLGVDGVYRAGS